MKLKLFGKMEWSIGADLVCVEVTKGEMVQTIGIIEAECFYCKC